MCTDAVIRLQWILTPSGYSTLNITLREDATVTCEDTFGPQSTSLRIASMLLSGAHPGIKKGEEGHIRTLKIMFSLLWLEAS